MAKPTEGQVDAALGMLTTLQPKQMFDESRRLNRAVTADGRPNLAGLDFLELRSPDGSTWRLRIDNAGVATWKKVT